MEKEVQGVNRTETKKDCIKVSTRNRKNAKGFRQRVVKQQVVKYHTTDPRKD